MKYFIPRTRITLRSGERVEVPPVGLALMYRIPLEDAVVQFSTQHRSMTYEQVQALRTIPTPGEGVYHRWLKIVAEARAGVDDEDSRLLHELMRRNKKGGDSPRQSPPICNPA